MHGEVEAKAQSKAFGNGGFFHATRQAWGHG